MAASSGRGWFTSQYTGMRPMWLRTVSAYRWVSQICAERFSVESKRQRTSRFSSATARARTNARITRASRPSLRGSASWQLLPHAVVPLPDIGPQFGRLVHPGLEAAGARGIDRLDLHVRKDL